MRAAEHFGSPTFSMAATQFTRNKLKDLFENNNSLPTIYYFGEYFLLPPKRTNVPSLFTICSHVIASQVIYGSSTTYVLYLSFYLLFIILSFVILLL